MTKLLTADGVGDPLASQPTLSRYENAVTIDALWKLLDLRVANCEHQANRQRGPSCRRALDETLSVPLHEVSFLECVLRPPIQPAKSSSPLGDTDQYSL